MAGQLDVKWCVRRVDAEILHLDDSLLDVLEDLLLDVLERIDAQVVDQAAGLPVLLSLVLLLLLSYLQIHQLSSDAALLVARVVDSLSIRCRFVVNSSLISPSISSR